MLLICGFFLSFTGWFLELRFNEPNPVKGSSFGPGWSIRPSGVCTPACFRRVSPEGNLSAQTLHITKNTQQLRAIFARRRGVDGVVCGREPSAARRSSSSRFQRPARLAATSPPRRAPKSFSCICFVACVISQVAAISAGIF